MRTFGWVMLALTFPAVMSAGVISGRVINGSSDGAGLPDLDVHLTGTLASGERYEQAATSDADGGFRFSDVPGDTADVYVVSASFGGLDYASRLLQFGVGQDEIGTDLFVYESTESLEDVKILGHHYILDAAVDVDSIMVTEYVAIANVGSRTVLSAAPLTFPLPPSAAHIRAFDGFETAELDGHDLRITATLRPGHLEGVVRYLLPAGAMLDFRSTITHPTDDVTILVSPTGSDVSGPGLEPMGVTELGAGIRYDRYRVLDTGVGATVSAVIRIARARAPDAWLVVGALVLAFLGLIYLRERSADGDRSVVSPDGRRLLRERDRYLQEIVDLERLPRTGDRADADVRRERETRLAKATAIQEMIDRLEETAR